MFRIFVPARPSTGIAVRVGVSPSVPGKVLAAIRHPRDQQAMRQLRCKHATTRGSECNARSPITVLRP